MNDLPTDWLDQLKTEYPKRSGPMRWPRVFLPVRRALMDVTWEQIIEGIKRYKAYAIASGKEGSDFVIGPESFFKDEIYKEQFEHKAPQDPKVIEARQKEERRWQQALVDASRLSPSLEPMRLESIQAFETRISLAKTHQREQPGMDVRRSGSDGHSGDISHRITDLAQRLKIAK